MEVPVARNPAPAAVDIVARVRDLQQSSPERDSSNDHQQPVEVGYAWSLVSRLVQWPTVDNRGPASLDNYPALRNQLLRDGASAWTEPPSRQAPADGATQPATYRQMLDSMLEDAGASKTAPGRPAGKTPIRSGVHS